MNREFNIIIPTYNNLVLFKKALNSVLNQDFRDFKVLITDDSSNDEICNYCRDLREDRIVYTRRGDRSGGAVGNWNNGLSLATGRYIIVLHHDEEFGDTHFLSRLYCSFSKGHDLVISDIRVKEEGKQLRKGRINGIAKKLFFKFPVSLFAINAIGPCACLGFSRQLIQEFDKNLTWLVDAEWYYRLIKSSKSMIYIQDSIVKSNSGHEDQITLNIDIHEKDKIDTAWLKQKYRSNLSVKIILQLKKAIPFLRTIIQKLRKV